MLAMLRFVAGPAAAVMAVLAVLALEVVTLAAGIGIHEHGFLGTI